MAEIRIATRREFLTHGLGVVGVGAAIPNFLVRTSLAGPNALSDERILVVVQLAGGHDGMTDVPPFGQEAYGRLRRNTRIAESDVIKLNDEAGLHPNLKGCKALLDEGRFAAVLGTGYPNFNYSHFIAMDIWETANLKGRQTGSGWIGRYLDCACKDNSDPKLSIAVGTQRTPLSFWSKQHPGLAFGNAESFRFAGLGDEKGRQVYRKLSELAQSHAKGELDFVTQTAIAANASSDQVRQVAANYKPAVTYPTTGIGNALRTIAGLIGGKLSTRVYFCSQGGYDTHSNQRPQHDRLMGELDAAISAFWKDMDQQGNAKRLLMMSFSEFGRRPEENGSQGTDHGSAQPMFLFGPAVNPGVHCKYPRLDDLQRDGNLKMQVDFRSVYATVLERWLHTPSDPVLAGSYPLLDCVKA